MQAAIAEIRRACQAGELRISRRELRWLDTLEDQAHHLPAEEYQFWEEIRQTPWRARFLPEEYGLEF
jgi:hypothetical protein